MARRSDSRSTTCRAMSHPTIADTVSPLVLAGSWCDLCLPSTIWCHCCSSSKQRRVRSSIPSGLCCSYCRIKVNRDPNCTCPQSGCTFDDAHDWIYAHDGASGILWVLPLLIVHKILMKPPNKPNSLHHRLTSPSCRGHQVISISPPLPPPC